MKLTIIGLVLTILLAFIYSCGLVTPPGFESIVSALYPETGGGSTDKPGGNAPIPRDGLIGEWLFNDGTVTETSGQNYSQGANTIIATNDRFGTPGKAAYLDPPQGNYIRIMATTNFDAASYNQLCVNFWVNTNLPGGPVFYLGDTGSINQPSLSVTVVGGNCIVMNKTNGFVNGLININAQMPITKEWVMVTVLFDKMNTPKARVFLNGQPWIGDGVSSLLCPISANLIYFGRDDVSYYNEMLDDIRVYNRMLSPAEIQVLFNDGTGSSGSSSSGSSSSAAVIPSWGQYGDMPAFGISNVQLDFDQNGDSYIFARNAHINVFKLNNATHLWNSYTAFSNFIGKASMVVLSPTNIYIGSYFGSSFSTYLSTNFVNTLYTNISNPSDGFVVKNDNGTPLPVFINSLSMSAFMVDYTNTNVSSILGPGTNAYQIAAFGQGYGLTPFAAAYDGSSTIFVVQKTGAETWNTIGNFPALSVVNLQITSDNGNVFLAYKDTVGSSTINFYYYNGTTWGGPKTTTDPMAGYTESPYSIGMAGVPYIAYVVQDTQNGTLNHLQIYRFDTNTLILNLAGVISNIGPCQSVSLRKNSYYGSLYAAFDDEYSYPGQFRVFTN